MHALGWLSAVAIASALGACDLPVEVGPGDAASSLDGRSRQQWRSQAISVERRIEGLERQIELKREQKWSLPASFDPSIAAQEAQLEQTIEDLEAQLEQLQDDLGSLEDEARRAGVPPGWLR